MDPTTSESVLNPVPLPQRVRKKPVIRSDEVVQVAMALSVQKAPEYDKDGMTVIWEKSDNRPEKRKAHDTTAVKKSTQEKVSTTERKRGRVGAEDPYSTPDCDGGKSSDM